MGAPFNQIGDELWFASSHCRDVGCPKGGPKAQECHEGPSLELLEKAYRSGLKGRCARHRRCLTSQQPDRPSNKRISVASTVYFCYLYLKIVVTSPLIREELAKIPHTITHLKRWTLVRCFNRRRCSHYFNISETFTIELRDDMVLFYVDPKASLSFGDQSSGRMTPLL